MDHGIFPTLLFLLLTFTFFYWDRDTCGHMVTWSHGCVGNNNVGLLTQDDLPRTKSLG